jgi:hypothetical protein
VDSNKRRRLGEVVSAVRQSPIPAHRLDRIGELAQVAEDKVAVEILIENVSDFQVSLPAALRSELLDIGQILGLADRYLKFLRDPV